MRRSGMNQAFPAAGTETTSAVLSRSPYASTSRRQPRSNNTLPWYSQGERRATNPSSGESLRGSRAESQPHAPRAYASPQQLTDGAGAAAQSTGAAALRRILQARPLALRVHRERAIVDQSTDLWAADLHGGRAQRKDNRGPRMLARMRAHRASCRPGGWPTQLTPREAMPRVNHKRGVFFRPSVCSSLLLGLSTCDYSTQGTLSEDPFG